jgi:hypothetical protein
MRLRLRRPLAALLLVLLGAIALALAACGGSDKDAKGLLKTAFSQPIQSADVSMDIQIKVDGVEQLKQPITVRLSGPYRSNGSKKLPSADFDLSFAGGGQTVNAGLASTGENAFVSFQGTDYEVGEDTVAQVNRQIAQGSSQRGRRSLADLGINPLDWVKDATEDGDEDVAGVETTHVSAGLDLGRLLDDLNEVVDRAGRLGTGATPQKLTDQQREQIEQVVKDPKFDVYVGKSDKKVRRLSADLDFDIPESARSRVGGAEGGSLAFSIEFANVGGQQRVNAPTRAKPIKELLDQLGGLSGLGGVGGGTGSAPGGGGSSGSGSGGSSGGSPNQTPDVKQFEKYSDCLRKANPNDVQALSKCAQLLR